MADLDDSYLPDGLQEEINEGADDNFLVSPNGDTSQGIEGSDVLDQSAEDAELEAIKARVREMEEEAEKLKEMQSEVEKQMNLTSPTTAGATAFPSVEEKAEADARSVYVGNVDYSATAEDLEAHFHGCGFINRVTILCNKFTGHPKGFAYIEFSEKDSVQLSEALNESLFKGRQIKVNPKRTNRPGISSTDYAPRGSRGGGYRGRYRGGWGGQSYHTGFTPRSRGRFRPRRFSRYSPY